MGYNWQRTIMKKISFLLMLMMLSSPLILYSATGYDAKINGVFYKFDYENNTAIVTRAPDDCNYHVSYPDTIVYIPSKIRYDGIEYIVNRINGCAFRDSYAKRVVLPNTILSIGGSAFFVSSIQFCIIPSGVKYIDGDILQDCVEIKYIEIGEDVEFIDNLGSCYQEENRAYFRNNISVRWNAINCSDFELGTYENVYFQGAYYYYYKNARTPFWKGRDDICYVGMFSNGMKEYSIPKEKYVMKNYITEFTFGPKVEHIPAYLCYNLHKLETITIPQSVKSIGEKAFGGCSSITSVTIEAIVPPIGNGGLNKDVMIYVPCQSYEAYKSSPDWSGYDIRISPYSYESHCTSTIVSIGCDSSDIYSVGIQGGEMFEGNTLEYIGLEPNSEYNDVPIVVNSNKGETATINISFATSALELTTQPSKPVSANTAILLAETNMADIETSCGFEYKRNDAPADMEGNKILCPVANGQMAGRLKGLKDDLYYKYRAFYKSSAGNMYYGDWQYIFTGDVAVEFDPILYTYEASNVQETQARLRGYALAGSDDFTEQGFEYWADSRTTPKNIIAHAPQATFETIGEHHTIQANGISMSVNLNNLDVGTTYHYRTYAKIGTQTLYGAEMSFTTKGEYTPPTYTITFVNYDNSPLLTLTNIEQGTLPVYTGDTPTRDNDGEYTYTFKGWKPEIVAAEADATYTATYNATKKTDAIDIISADENSICPRKIIENGRLYIILPSGKKYTATGEEVR